ncbi:MAG: hypothetical protein WBB23_23950 [Desulforhopalus sp.]
MKCSKTLIYIIFSSVVWQLVIFQPNGFAEEGNPGNPIDCTEVSVDYSEDPTLTREERIRLMDKAFFESLNRFELCWEEKENAKAAGGTGTGSGSGAGGSAGSESEAGAASSVESVAGSTMSGTEIASENTPEDIQTTESGALQSAQDIENINEAGNSTAGTVKMANGKIPEDIPPAKNDDALAAQIRYAAENEPDPVKSEQLWNEYRKYKGLAPKK